MKKEQTYFIVYQDGSVRPSKEQKTIDGAIVEARQEAVRLSNLILSQVGFGPISHKDKLSREVKALEQKSTFVVNIPGAPAIILGEKSLFDAILLARRFAVENSEIKLLFPVDFKKTVSDKELVFCFDFPINLASNE